MIEKNIDINKLKKIFNDYRKNYDPIINDFTKIYVFTIDNNIVAFLIFTIMYNKCEIVDIFVEEKYRNRGIAQNLIKEIIKDFDVENITLEVSENNISAIKLYEKLDFKKVAIRKNYYKDNDGFLMLKEVR